MKKRISFDGKIITEAKSINFAKMKEDEFSVLYKKTIDSIIKYFHFDKQDILDNIEQYF